MKTTLGGKRLGAGGKQIVTTNQFPYSTHDLSFPFRTTMSVGTLVPFMFKVGLPGDTIKIDLNTDVKTLPTVGPLFGSCKLQMDVFEIPMRLYNVGVMINMLEIGNNMENAYFPKMELRTNNHADYVQTYDDNEHVNPSSLIKYMGVSGLGRITGNTNPAVRRYNALKLVMYWDTYKHYYANKQEERGFVIHTSNNALQGAPVQAANLTEDGAFIDNILNNTIIYTGTLLTEVAFVFLPEALEPDPEQCTITINGTDYNVTEAFNQIIWDEATNTLNCSQYNGVEVGAVEWDVPNQNVPPLGGEENPQINIEEFPLSNIDDMRTAILQWPYASGEFVIDVGSPAPYGLPMTQLGAGAEATYSMQYSQEGLGLKTYQSDLFNNWLNTDWIDGAGGINEVTSIDTSGGSFTIDALNLAKKIHKLLNNVAISGGSYDDWLDAVYDHERARTTFSPVYHGSLIKEIAFQEVISTADTQQIAETGQPLGTLAGRGVLTKKHKGGKMQIKVDEPCYIMGIVSITPRIDYSQGNDWDMNLDTFNDLHKPDLDQIGFQDLITEQMLWTNTVLNSDTGELTYNTAGKQPAWINYMTSVGKCFGNFADQNKEMFMTYNRRYETDTQTGAFSDLTTYIDPTKYNHIFADTKLDAQNFWVQIGVGITARRKMSAKVIPNP